MQLFFDASQKGRQFDYVPPNSLQKPFLRTTSHFCGATPVPTAASPRQPQYCHSGFSHCSSTFHRKAAREACSQDWYGPYSEHLSAEEASDIDNFVTLRRRIPESLCAMTSPTTPCLACWPCVELLRQYELLRVRFYYEDLCGSFMHRESRRARILVWGEDGTSQQKGYASVELSPPLRNPVSVEKHLRSFSELTPRESFNRWVMERRSVPARHADPLIPSIQCCVSADKNIFRETVLSDAGDENVNVFGQDAPSVTCAGEFTRNSEVGKTPRGTSVKDEENAETNELACATAISVPCFDRSSTATLEREILEDLPMKVAISSTPAKSRESLAEYARAVGSIMLEEKRKVERVPLHVLSPLVKTLLMLLRGERGVSGQDSEVSTGSLPDSRKSGAADLLVALSAEIYQQRGKRGSITPQRDVSRDTEGERGEGGASNGDTHVFSGKPDSLEEGRQASEDFWSESLGEPTDAFYGRKAADGQQETHSGNASSGGTSRFHSVNNTVTEEPFSSAVNETVRSMCLASDFIRKSSTASDCSFSKDDVYYTVCLARPVVKAIYGNEVRAMMKTVEGEAHQAATRVAQYAECLTLEHAEEGECSAHHPAASGSSTVPGTSINRTVQKMNSGAEALPLEFQSIRNGPYSGVRGVPGGARSLVGANSAQRGGIAARAGVFDRREAMINGGRALHLNTRASRRHSVTRAVEDKGVGHPLKGVPRLKLSASGGHLLVNNIRWISCRDYECFVYVGDVEVLAWDHCESVRTDVFRSLRSRYTLKGYKVAQLWARFISKKLGQKVQDLVRGECMYVECACRGRGLCREEQTCTCVRRQIRRIQNSAYAGEFTILVFCLLCRYYSVCGCRNQGKGLHSAAPSELMQLLGEQLGVECELFASPLNVSLNRYCSLFPDIDAFFGSEGSFFDPNFTVEEGSYEANPPFEEFLMSRVVSRIEQWLDVSAEGGHGTEAQRPLSFCILVPYWPAGPSQYMYALLRSKYVRFTFVIPEGQHYYLSGFQHFCSGKEVARVAVCKTLFAVLQNEAGAHKWPVTPEIAKQIKATWKPRNVFTKCPGGPF